MTANRAVAGIIAVPSTMLEWQDYYAALDVIITAEVETLGESRVKPGLPLTPG